MAHAFLVSAEAWNVLPPSYSIQLQAHLSEPYLTVTFQSLMAASYLMAVS